MVPIHGLRFYNTFFFCNINNNNHNAYLYEPTVLYAFHRIRIILIDGDLAMVSSGQLLSFRCWKIIWPLFIFYCIIWEISNIFSSNLQKPACLKNILKCWPTFYTSYYNRKVVIVYWFIWRNFHKHSTERLIFFVSNDVHILKIKIKLY